MSESIHRLHALVSGRVQGVNFRQATAQRAQPLQLTGWMRNLPGGTVEVWAEGPRPMLEQLAQFLQHGPPAAAVSQVQITWATDLPQYQRFDVRW